MRDTFKMAARYLAQGQTNFVRMLWKFSKVYNPDRQIADHHRPIHYKMDLPKHSPLVKIDPASLYVHHQEESPARSGTQRSSSAG